MKLTKRKGFNFFRSYYDVYNELNDEDKLAFIDAILDRQFLGTKPKDLKGMAKFAYISQTNSIDAQVKGYEDKTETRLDGRPYYKGDEAPIDAVKINPTDGGSETPTQQVEEKGEEKEKEQQQDVEEKKVDVEEIDKHIEKLSKQQIWQESFYMHYRVSKGSLSKILKSFKNHLILQPPEDANKSYRDFLKHFTNWCNVQDQKGKLNEYKKYKSKTRGAL